MRPQKPIDMPYDRDLSITHQSWVLNVNIHPTQVKAVGVS
jgi:hypothetical protein